MQTLSPSLTQADFCAEKERAYCADVLGLQEDQTEEQVDEGLQTEAKELGVDIMGLLIPFHPATGVEEPRRSESIDSRASRSTGFASTFSEVSRDPGNGRRMSRTSLSFRDYDYFLSRGRPDGRQSLSFSPPTTPSHSTFSLPLSSPAGSPKRSFRHLRGLSMLKLRRTESGPVTTQGCPHCPRDAASQRRAQHEVPCGHHLCTQALRQMTQSATASRTGAVPSCCGIPVPGKIIEHVMTQDERIAVLDKLEKWEEATTVVFPNASEAGPLSKATRPALGGRTASGDSKVDSVVPGKFHLEHTQQLQEQQDFLYLQEKHSQLKDRFTSWIDQQRADLQRSHERLRVEMKARHETATEDLLERHANAMSEAEDKQVKAEADMREVHAQEKRDNATALRHMEAYCAGTYSNGDLHGRTVTEQDLAELEKARKVRDAMDPKHGSAINVLRGEQGRRIKLRAQRQEKEMQESNRNQRKEELEFGRACTAEVGGFEGMLAEKQRRINVRWEMQVAILAKKAEIEATESQSANALNSDLQQQVEGGAQSGTSPMVRLQQAIPVEGVGTGMAVASQA